MDCSTMARLASDMQQSACWPGRREFSMKKNLRTLLQGLLLAVTGCSIVAVPAWTADESQSDIAQRLDASTKALNEVMANPQKAIPGGIIRRATCVAVFPSTVQVAVLVGAKHGKGCATCRTATGWSAPAPLDISGGSWGAQLGGEPVDLVILITDQEGMEQFESGK